MKKRKYIEIEEEVVERLKNGKRIDGSIGFNPVTNKLEFKAFNRMTENHRKCTLICRLEHGWVKGSKERIKVYESIDKALGVARINAILDREIDDVKRHLIDWDIIEKI